MLKIGIIGVGYLGNFHLKNLLTHKNITVPGFFDIDENRSAFIAADYRVKSFASRAELLQACDAVFVVVPTKSHYEVTQEALENGLHVFCEKPVTEKIEQAERLMKIAAQKGLVLQVGHIERFNPAFKALEHCQLYPKFIECHRISMFNERGIKSAVIPELMIHDLDILLTIVNSKITDIQASGTPVLTDNVDIANVRINFENGCVANVTASRISDKVVRKFRIFQENAYINIDFLEKKTEFFAMEPLDKNYYLIKNFDLPGHNKKTIYYKCIEGKEVNAMVEEQKNFIDAVTKNQPPLVTGEDGLAALKLAHRIEAVIQKNLSKLEF
ncbi:MAG: Gfo/Idh/MocA family oxidoreductase [Candidatus Marinimicrobia bacterium]|nr:Gfo/Idh/MocA family oxidoreductase [Candidatus Neomarinimicrobiota bacterium]